eukprot:s3779_g4.t1
MTTAITQTLLTLIIDALELFKEVDFDGSGWTSNAFDCLTQAFIAKGDAKKAMIISEEAVEYFERKNDKRGPCG